MAFILYLIPVALYLLYRWAVKNNDYFKKQGIAYMEPLPLLGSSFGLFFKKQSMVKSFMDSYYQFKDEK